MMNALIINRYGDADNLLYNKVAKPTMVSTFDVIVKVHAAGVNPMDFKIRRGLLQMLKKTEFPAILGIDYSGIVTEVGSSVTEVKVGDSVYGKLGEPSSNGCYAEYVKLDTRVDVVLPKPSNLSYEQGAAVGVVAITACVALFDHGKLTAGDGKRVLVIGASGGVGSWAVQIAKAMGSHVTAICSSKNAEFVSSLGADIVIDYTKSMDSKLRSCEAFDIVVDAVGGEDYWRLIQPFVVRGGMYATCVGPDALGNEPVGIGFLLGVISKSIWRNSCGRVHYQFITVNPISHFPRIDGWLKAGKIKVMVNQSFALKDGAAAHRLSETNRTVGKIVLLP